MVLFKMAFIVNGRNMSESLDRHITGNYGEDNYICCDDCAHSKYESDTNEYVCTKKGGCDKNGLVF